MRSEGASFKNRLNPAEVDLIVKTRLGLEEVAGARLEELGFKVWVKPYGFLGLVLASTDKPLETAVELAESVAEVERVLPVYGVAESKLDSIVEEAVRVAMDKVRSGSFAVRATRRGNVGFKSIDVNTRVGAEIKRTLNLPVDLEFPDNVILVEIVGEYSYISVIKGSSLHRKITPEKEVILPYLSRISVAQIPYTGSPEACRSMGLRIGRAVQSFEISDITVTPISPVRGSELKAFLEGLEEGIESRFKIQKKIYSRKPRKVEVFVYDLYQLVRSRRSEPLIVFEPEGVTFDKVEANIVADILNAKRRVTLLFGAREGIPIGVWRFARYIVDLCPGITLPTDYAASSGLITIAYALEKHLKRAKGRS